MASSSHILNADQVETDAVIAEKHQSCSRCHVTVLGSRQSRQDILCSSCVKTQGFDHPAHKCSLFLMTVINIIWTCSGCKKSCKDLEDTSCYHCSSCDFNLCQSCYQPKKYLVHKHDLTKTDVTSVYVRTKGNWRCDCCGGNNGPNHL